MARSFIGLTAQERADELRKATDQAILQNPTMRELLRVRKELSQTNIDLRRRTTQLVKSNASPTVKSVFSARYKKAEDLRWKAQQDWSTAYQSLYKSVYNATDSYLTKQEERARVGQPIQSPDEFIKAEAQEDYVKDQWARDYPSLRGLGVLDPVTITLMVMAGKALIILLTIAGTLLLINTALKSWGVLRDYTAELGECLKQVQGFADPVERAAALKLCEASAKSGATGLRDYLFYGAIAVGAFYLLPIIFRGFSGARSGQLDLEQQKIQVERERIGLKKAEYELAHPVKKAKAKQQPVYGGFPGWFGQPPAAAAQQAQKSPPKPGGREAKIKAINKYRGNGK